MHYHDVIGYAFEADLHCVGCAQERFGAALDADGTEDADGNPVHPVFAGDEGDEHGEYCGDCGEEIREPVSA